MSLDRFENKDEVIGVSPVFGETMFSEEEPRIEKFNDLLTQNDIMVNQRYMLFLNWI